MRKLGSLNLRRKPAVWVLVAVFTSVLALPVGANGAEALLDDFSDASKSSKGIERFLIDDSSVGGKSAMRQSLQDGILCVEGEIAPARGQPGWVSIVLATASTGESADLSQYVGVKLRIRVTKGNLTLSVNSSEVTNFDYHVMAIGRTGDAFKEVRIPFKDMKRMWSEQTKLNLETIQSISVVAADFQKGSFAYDIDEISFY